MLGDIAASSLVEEEKKGKREEMSTFSAWEKEGQGENLSNSC